MACLLFGGFTVLVKRNGLYMKERKDMCTLTRRAKNKVQFMNICQLAPHYSHIVDLFNVSNHDVNCNKFDISQIRSNTIVLDKADNWNELLFKEALLIKSHKPSLNTDLKALKELQLF